MRVELLYCPGPGQVDRSVLELPEGSTLDAALLASGLLQRHALHLPDVVAGVWSKIKPYQTVLRDGDRVEIYRPLTVDPKEARRLRYWRQGRRPRAAASAPAEQVVSGNPS